MGFESETGPRYTEKNIMDQGMQNTIQFLVLQRTHGKGRRIARATRLGHKKNNTPTYRIASSQCQCSAEPRQSTQVTGNTFNRNSATQSKSSIVDTRLTLGEN